MAFHQRAATIGAVCGLAVSLVAQTTPSPASLVRDLVDPKAKSASEQLMWDIGLFSCGFSQAEEREIRDRVTAIVNLGPAAIPAIESALDGHTVRMNLSWLLLAYVRIQGPAAHSRLQALYREKDPQSQEIGIDNAIALSLNLTSYASAISNSRMNEAPMPIARSFLCRGDTPSDALNRLIRAWTEGAPTLERMLPGSDWKALRAKLWQAPQGRRIGIGYRMEGVETIFTNASGNVCGHLPLTFKQLRSTFTASGPTEYALDTDNVPELLQLLSTCASQSRL